MTDTPNLLFLDHIEEDVEVKANTTEINGTDGVLIGPTTFGPFNLVLNFSFKGLDTKDLKLYKQKIRNILYQREPYYVWHSDAPGKKYAVYCDSNDNEDLTNSFATFKVTFVVFKGYSESLKDTSQFSLSSGDWQFEAVARADDSIKYTHTSDYFVIYNGSSDTIDPLLRHKLQIQIKADAPEGITIRNLTTEDKFVYKKPLTPSKTLTLQGVHPLLDGNRVGVDTNWQWITLAPGYNTIKIENDSIKSVETKWSFNFIYR
ncbi:MAG TPA: phage tail family protein [Staphylococcus kloosii]|uniref:Phage tail family protein n=1 Tax=Staphylococcus kloosii TaxID=29384 RepID=A0A921KUZ9_9STAP|nr:distal tail protein Dit [Staphylococcus kloosii]HJF67086.1 phage tail family protein [Staphylococcus kloosii]